MVTLSPALAAQWRGVFPSESVFVVSAPAVISSVTIALAIGELSLLLIQRADAE